MSYLLLGLFLPSLALASFDGSFAGAGLSRFHKSGNERKCSEIYMTFQRGEKSLRVVEGGYSCGDMQASYPTFTLDIRDGKLFSDGNEVGTLTENRLELGHQDAIEDYTYRLVLERKGESLEYLEEWTESGQPALTVKGELKAN